MKNVSKFKNPLLFISTLLYAVLDKYRQMFVVIDIKEAKEKGLNFVGNVYGDEINRLNCRSIWRDSKNRSWRVEQLGAKNNQETANNDNKVLAVVDLESTEDYFKRQIENGFILGDGTPIKCECGCIDFKQVNQVYGSGWIEEYSLECRNEDCLKIVGHWAYGHWSI